MSSRISYGDRHSAQAEYVKRLGLTNNHIIEPLSALIREAPTAIVLCIGGYLALKRELSIGIFVLKDLPILLLNEPSSVLHVYSEKMINQTLVELMKENLSPTLSPAYAIIGG